MARERPLIEQAGFSGREAVKELCARWKRFKAPGSMPVWRQPISEKSFWQLEAQLKDQTHAASVQRLEVVCD